MKDWMTRLDAFLRFNEREVLNNLGTISTEVARVTAISEYERFDEHRRREEVVAADKKDMEALAEYIDRLEHEGKDQ